jgi:hypothetical protein
MITESLKSTLTDTLLYFDLGENDLKKQYGQGKWTVKEILVHLADVESVLHYRIRRIIAEPKQVIWAFDQDQWTEAFDYKNYPLYVSKELFVANRNAIIYLAEKFYGSHGAREFIHSETGIRTLKDEFDKVFNHNQLHINQIQKALT